MLVENESNRVTRKDGRSNTDMQEIFIQKGVKRDCTSSVYLETTHLKMMCSINGPIYQSVISKTKDDAGKMSVNVNVLIPSYYQDTVLPFNKNNVESQLEDLFSKNIFVEKYARTKMIINIEVFEFTCNILPYAIMAITLALNYANIEQKGLITSSNLVYKDNQIIVDPTFEEEKSAEYKLVFGCIMDLQENNIFIQSGKIEDENENKKIIGTAIKMCEAYQNFLITKL